MHIIFISELLIREAIQSVIEAITFRSKTETKRIIRFLILNFLVILINLLNT